MYTNSNHDKFPMKSSASQDRKCSALRDMTNSQSRSDTEIAIHTTSVKFDESHWFPIQPVMIDEPSLEISSKINYQNVHPYLAFYQHDLKTGSISHTDLCSLLSPDNELSLLPMLQETGVVAEKQQCKYCGGPMHFHKQSKTWYWICNRRVNGVKCNRGKFAVTDGTMFSKSHLSIADIIWIIWHFLHHLSENQCKQYTNIGQNNCKTVVKWYNKCRNVCGKWIWANKPKLGGYGNIVEMDESHFAGVPKYSKGRRIGEDPWKQWNKWVFGLTQRGSLDCVLQTVHSSRSRAI